MAAAQSHRPAEDLIERIDPQEAHRQLSKDPAALLICAYDDEEKWRKNRLEGAISLADFQARVGGLEKNRRLIFYCA
jgi:rhodanese-related sulfurtransferase